jgi:hypothetical protein
VLHLIDRDTSGRRTRPTPRRVPGVRGLRGPGIVLASAGLLGLGGSHPRPIASNVRPGSYNTRLAAGSAVKSDTATGNGEVAATRRYDLRHPPSHLRCLVHGRFTRYRRRPL